jgi:glycerol uptake facilitator-like aquaporin
MNTMTVILILAAALAGAMIFQAIVFFLFMREFKNLLKDMLNRLMARDFTEYVRGEASLHPAPEAETARREEDAIPI